MTQRAKGFRRAQRIGELRFVECSLVRNPPDPHCRLNQGVVKGVEEIGRAMEGDKMASRGRVVGVGSLVFLDPVESKPSREEVVLLYIVPPNHPPVFRLGSYEGGDWYNKDTGAVYFPPELWARIPDPLVLSGTRG